MSKYVSIIYTSYVKRSCLYTQIFQYVGIVKLTKITAGDNGNSNLVFLTKFPR